MILGKPGPPGPAGPRGNPKKTLILLFSNGLNQVLEVFLDLRV